MVPISFMLLAVISPNWKRCGSKVPLSTCSSMPLAFSTPVKPKPLLFMLSSVPSRLNWPSGMVKLRAPVNGCS